MIISRICVVFIGIFLFLGTIQYFARIGSIEKQKIILEIATFAMLKEQDDQQKQLAIKQEADRIQSTKVFYLDVRIQHGSAFGGFCATMNDGRRKKGRIVLDDILLYGKHPSGKTFTYYIEEQNIEIGATDDPEVLIIRTNDDSYFEIRQNGQGRDQGARVQSALIHKDMEYFIILESKHEIAIKAMKGC